MLLNKTLSSCEHNEDRGGEIFTRALSGGTQPHGKSQERKLQTLKKANAVVDSFPRCQVHHSLCRHTPRATSASTAASSPSTSASSEASAERRPLTLHAGHLVVVVAPLPLVLLTVPVCRETHQQTATTINTDAA